MVFKKWNSILILTNIKASKSSSRGNLNIWVTELQTNKNLTEVRMLRVAKLIRNNKMYLEIKKYDERLPNIYVAGNFGQFPH